MEYQDQRLEPSNYAVIRWFGFDRFVPEQAVTSHWVSSKTFLFIRLPILLYSIIVIWTDIGITASEGDGSRFFAYFTHLTFIGLHAYLVTATYHHVRYLLINPRRPASFLDQPTIINYLYVYLYHTIITFNIVTPVVYWAVLAKPMIQKGNVSTIEWWMTCSVHAASFFMMMADVIFNRMKVYINMVVLAVVTVIFYMFLTFIVHATTNWWVYSFLDWNQGGKAAGWYIMVGVIVVLAFFLQFGIHTLRDWIAAKTGRSTEHRQRPMEEVGSVA